MAHVISLNLKMPVQYFTCVAHVNSLSLKYLYSTVVFFKMCPFFHLVRDTCIIVIYAGAPYLFSKFEIPVG